MWILSWVMEKKLVKTEHLVGVPMGRKQPGVSQRLPDWSQDYHWLGRLDKQRILPRKELMDRKRKKVRKSICKGDYEEIWSPLTQEL